MSYRLIKINRIPVSIGLLLDDSAGFDQYEAAVRQEEAVANAAPELLAHLSRIIEAADRLPTASPLDGLIDEARAVVAKATGK